jgi:hypothetical protein
VDGFGVDGFWVDMAPKGSQPPRPSATGLAGSRTPRTPRGGARWAG